MVTLQEDAARKVLAGLTSVQEVLRVTAAQEFYV
jgi:type II secretory ATPase GspE/PulE/Tfp pilus assembly ATPase PilB-like protein